MEQKRICKTCTKEFLIIRQEAEFLKAHDLPLPTECPKCRKEKREKWVSVPYYKEYKCFNCGEPVLVWLKQTDNRPVYCHSCTTKLRKSGQIEIPKPGYKKGISFLKQLNDLVNSLYIVGAPYRENTRYAENAIRSYECPFTKNTVDSFDLSKCINTVNSQHIITANNCVDSTFSTRIEYSVQTISCSNCSNSSYLTYCNSCTDCHYCDNCNDSSHCFGCSGLRNKKYYIFNKQYDKDTYYEEVNDLLNLPHNELLEKVNSFKQTLPIPATIQDGDISNCKYTSNVANCTNCYYAFDSYNIQNCGYLWHVGTTSDSWDLSNMVRKTTNSYECSDLAHSDHCYYSSKLFDVTNVYFSHDLYKCTNCFGCVKLHDAKYHILNKGYTKDEYDEIVSLIRDEINLHYDSN